MLNHRDRLIIESGENLAPLPYVISRYNEKVVIMVLCECGCGEELDFSKGKKSKRFILGHHLKNKSPWNKGLKNFGGGTLKGTKFSEEHKRKLSESHKGNTPWNKGLNGYLAGKPKVVLKLKGRNDGYCDAWADDEYRDDLRGNLCEGCGMSNEESLEKWNERLSLHHSEGDKTKCAPSDIQTFCKSCHAKADWRLRKC